MTSLTLADLTPDTPEGADHPLEPTTVAFIQSLVEPWAAQIRAHDAETLHELIRWAQRTFPEAVIEPSDYALGEPNVEAERGRLIKLLGLSLSIPTTNYMEWEEIDTAVLPWDIVTGTLRHEPEVAQFFGFDDENGHVWLPVTVTANGQRFTHLMTKWMALGLVLFSRISGFDFAPEMFGVPFSYFDDTARHRIFEYPWTEGPSGYHITIERKDYCMSNMVPINYFLQGFSTGALWAGVDHHNYWSNFFYSGAGGVVVDLTF